ncbi:hypothetical protein WICPIJ_008893 [Wickerhamomyces pijperi]|uniref:Uncharacterized protein n=1 Tax=Wickerhamomyces pijperi TaxID=599730 RepID=A0A9P8TG14_WICPI|nr:hypothetical protein WICPIJ_008893 [Wickerhamomyces pijperi]
MDLEINNFFRDFGEQIAETEFVFTNFFSIEGPITLSLSLFRTYNLTLRRFDGVIDIKITTGLNSKVVTNTGLSLLSQDVVA